MDHILQTKLREIFTTDDPMSIYFKDVNNFDEYDPEIDRIVSQGYMCQNTDELLDVVWEVFKKQFSPINAGPREKYAGLTKKVWKILQLKEESAPPVVLGNDFENRKRDQ